MVTELKVSVNVSAMDVSYISIVISSAGFRTRHTGHVPRGLHKIGPPQKQTFVFKYLGCMSYVSQSLQFTL